MKKTTFSFVLLLTTILFISCDKNKKLYQNAAENAIKEFVAANSFEAGTWQQGSFSVYSILSIEPVSQFTETEASTVAHFDFQDSYSNGKLVLKFKFQKDINKQWFLTGIEAVSGVGSQGVSDLIRKWSSLNILVQNIKQGENVQFITSENSTEVGKIVASGSSSSSSSSSGFTTVNELKTSKGLFPIITLADSNKATELNSYISKQIFGKNYNLSEIKSVIEIKNWDDTFTNYSQVKYEIKANTKTELLINIEMCFMGAAEHGFAYQFRFNPSSGSREVQSIEE